MTPPGSPPSARPPFHRDPEKRALLYQAALLLAVGCAAWYLFHNTLANLARQHIATGFGFLGKEAGFEIGESLIPYSAASTYGRALVVGVLNTLKISAVGIALTLVLGTVIGIARLSSNWLVARLSAVYIETLRNIPVLLQLFFWYALVTEVLPAARQAVHPIPGVFLSNRGFFFPVPEWHEACWWVAAAFVLGCAGAVAVSRFARRRREATGAPFPVFLASTGLVAGLPLCAWLLLGAPLTWDVPALAGFNFRGGQSVSPEFGALILGLMLYTASFVAEIVRSGIESVSKGQREAAQSLGLRPSFVLRLVVLPQALRVIVPPLTSQMLNFMKNTSLAVAIGYPDFVAVANTAINQTGQAIEGVGLIMAVYLAFSLATSAFMNWYNRRIALVER